MDKGSEKFGDGLLVVESGLGQITSCVEQSGNTEIVGVKADQKPGGDEMITVAKAGCCGHIREKWRVLERALFCSKLIMDDGVGKPVPHTTLILPDVRCQYQH